MNKQLIITYFEEFKHWLNEGKLLQNQINLVIPAEWEEFEEDWDWPIDELAVIIKDEYVEFRKALAEGKEIEYSMTDLNGNHIRWVNILEQENSYNIDTKVFNYELSAYRIKPEEPKFKAGDWIIITAFDNKKFIVRYYNHKFKENILTINNTIHFPSGRGLGYTMLWQPQVDEWCWFYNSLTDTPTLSKLISIESIYERPEIYLAETPSCISKTSYGYSSSIQFKFCEPFLGELPSFLQH